MSYKNVGGNDGDAGKPMTNIRTDYRCKAHGCPNTGAIDDMCYFHWREPDPAKWAALTTRIRENFETMRNW